jgi:hypothetical protein
VALLVLGLWNWQPSGLYLSLEKCEYTDEDLLPWWVPIPYYFAWDIVMDVGHASAEAFDWVVCVLR